MSRIQKEFNLKESYEKHKQRATELHTIAVDPICENANSNRPRCFDAPSGNINSGCACFRNRGS